MNRSSNKFLKNRSIPECTVIPVLGYEDVEKASDWLCNAFGFTVRLRIANHRVQLLVGDGAIVVNEGHYVTEANHSIMVRVEDVDRHHEHALEQGATILHPPTSNPYGERQYSVQDIGGHRWTFSQSIADADPDEWGGQWGKDDA